MAYIITFFLTDPEPRGAVCTAAGSAEQEAESESGGTAGQEDVRHDGGGGCDWRPNFTSSGSALSQPAPWRCGGGGGERDTGRANRRNTDG